MHRSLLTALLLTTISHALDRSPVVEVIDNPTTVADLGGGRYFVDFGEETFGNIRITPRDVPSGTKVRVHLGEQLSAPRTIQRKPGPSIRYQTHELTLTKGVTASPVLNWAPPDWMKEGWLDLPKGTPQIMPFRYVELENMPASFKADQIQRVSIQIPFDENASAFSSSDPRLDAVWKLCKHSVKATSFLGLYVDGDRERKPYEADALINQLSHYSLDARYDTGRFTHEYLLEKPTWPTEWRLQSVILAWHDYLWSGDDSSLKKHYAVLVGRAMTTQRTPDGLFLGSNKGDIRDIVDWPSVERDGYDMDKPVKTVVTAFHYRAVLLLSAIADHLGKREDAMRFKEMARTTFKAVNESLWDEAKGCYVDGIDPTTKSRSSHASSHANFFPLALGLVPTERIPKVAAFLKSRGMVCSVYGAQFLLEALYDAGESETALSLLTSDQLRSWRNMSEKIGATITLEAWDPSLKPNLDWNHAWATAPSNIIPRKLMGIEPIEAGFKRFSVKPRTTGLTQAKVKMPTPKGPIILEINGTSPTDWKARIIVPPGTAAEFNCPFPGQPRITGTSNTAPSRILRQENEHAVAGLPPGTWEISMK
ncbi:MAG: family 78 glycoside hydrolase catalytic domain [Luteolibacter sp.]